MSKPEAIDSTSAPHPPLTDYYAAETERRNWVRDIFNRTAVDYDRVERAMAFGSGAMYRRQALLRAGLTEGMQVLDVGMGTGLVTREAVRVSGEARLVTGVDPSPGMIAAADLPPEVQKLHGSAEQLPVANNAYDFVSMGYALRHVADLHAAFAEFFRVLRPGGKLCVLEISRPQGRISTALLKVYMRSIVPVLARLLASHADTPHLFRYYWDTIEACVAPNEIIAALAHAGFAQVEREVKFGMFSEYRARKPD